MSHQSFHRIIFKNTGLFGISQIIKIAVKVLANKAAAIFLGTAGIGIIGLLENIIGIIQSVTGLGIASSSIREIALVTDETEVENSKEQRLLKIIYHWAIATGIIGTIITIIFSKYISEEVFNSDHNFLWIIILSLYFIFSSISSSRLAVLQAKKMISQIVKFHILTAVITAILSITLYYWYQKNGIIPVLIGSVFIQFMYSLYLTRNIKISSDNIPFKQIFNEGLPMVKLGILLSLSSIFGQICFYIIRWFLKEYNSFEILGIYQVSNTLLIGYLGLVFAAMSNDFYPRLCNYESDQKKFNDLVNDQTEIALLLVVPAILIFYLTAPFFIPLLYSKNFLPVIEILKFGLFAIVLKALVWPIGFISLVKGNKLLFMKQNLLGDAVNVIASIVAFKYFGLLGLGIALVIMFVASGFYNYFVSRKIYNFRYRIDTLKIISFSVIIGLIGLFVVLFLQSTFNYYFLIPLLIISLVFSSINLKSKLKV